MSSWNRRHEFSREFCGPAAERNLQDLAWIAPRACRHEEVVEEVMGYGPVLPSRFGSIFSSAQKLDDFCRRHEAAIQEFLDRAAGHEEWAVKAWLDREKAREILIASAQADSGARLKMLSPGRRYIEAQKIRSEADRNLLGIMQERCARAAEDLRSRASAFTEYPARGAGEGRGEVLRHFAFLVPKTGVASFRQRVPPGEQNGLSFQVTGPWPPYSFAPALGGEAG